MKPKILIISIVIILLLVISLLVYDSSAKDNSKNLQTQTKNTTQAQTKTQTSTPTQQIKYFNSATDKLTVSATDHVLYTNNPTTTLTYYATNSKGNLVHFKPEDKAHVRILGITHLYTQNTEIPHPKNADGTIDDTIFTGKINISEPGKYLIKVCLGKTINLDSEGNMIYPFGCFEDSTSDVIDVYGK